MEKGRKKTELFLEVGNETGRGQKVTINRKRQRRARRDGKGGVSDCCMGKGICLLILIPVADTSDGCLEDPTLCVWTDRRGIDHNG